MDNKNKKITLRKISENIFQVHGAVQRSAMTGRYIVDKSHESNGDKEEPQ